MKNNTLFLLLTFVCSSLFSISNLWLKIPLGVNNIYSSSINVDFFSDQQSILVEKKSFINALEPQISQEALEYIKHQFLQNDHLKIPKDTMEGFRDSFGNMHLLMQEEKQIINLSIDPLCLQTKISNLKGMQQKEYKNEGVKIDPATFSGYCNIELGQKIQTSFIPAVSGSIYPFTTSLDFTLNYKENVLEGFVYVVATNQEVNRGSFTLTRDLYEHSLRCTLGDINSRSIGYQSAIPLLGLSLNHNANLFNNKTIDSYSRQTIFLNAPSTVSVYVNNTLINTLELPAGPHSIENFPLTSGLNDVSIKIEDPTGGIKYINLQSLYDPQFLKKNELIYSSSIGVPKYDSSNQKFSYDFSKPLYSGMFNYGLDAFQNIGGYLQLTAIGQFMGLQYITLLDQIKNIVNIAIGKRKSVSPSARIGYLMSTRVGHKSKMPMTLQAGCKWTSKGFGQYYSFVDEYPEWLSFALNVGQSFYGSVTMSVGTQLQLQRNRKGVERSFTFGLSTSPFRVGNLGIFFSQTKGIGSQPEANLLFSFSCPLGKEGKSIVSSDVNTYQRTMNTSWYHKYTPTASSQIVGKIGVGCAPGKNNLIGNVSYKDDHLQGSLKQYLAQTSSVDIHSTVAVTDFLLGSSFVFAGSSWSFSAPIHDSFLLIKPKEFLQGKKVYIDPEWDGTSSKICTTTSPYVLKISSPYRKIHFCVGSANLPFGFEMGETNYSFYPKYKNSGAIEIGEGIHILLETKLIDENNKPLSGVVGYFIPCAEPEKKIKFFTSQNGSLQLCGLMEGMYRILVHGLHHKETFLEVKREGQINICKIKNTIIKKNFTK